MKAFANSLLMVVVGMLLLELVLFFHVFAQRADRAQLDVFAPKYAAYYFDDISDDLSILAGDNLTIGRLNATYVAVDFTSPQSSYSLKSALGNYTVKLGNASQKFSVNLTLNTSLVADENITYNFSNGISYHVQYGNPYLAVLAGPPSVDFRNYSISYSSQLTRQSLQEFGYNPVGDIYVKVSYSDANGTYAREGFLDLSSPNIFRADYTDGSYFQARVEGIGGNARSLNISKSDAGGTAHVGAVIENNDTREFYYSVPVFVNITQFIYSKAAYPVRMRV